jgi:YD repeat-containing protein
MMTQAKLPEPERGAQRKRRRRNKSGISIRRLAVLGAALLACAATAAAAAETITFSYDARGRLVKVVRTGSVNNGVTTQYSHDKADNRVVKTVTGAP